MCTSMHSLIIIQYNIQFILYYIQYTYRYSIYCCLVHFLFLILQAYFPDLYFINKAACSFTAVLSVCYKSFYFHTALLYCLTYF